MRSKLTGLLLVFHVFLGAAFAQGGHKQVADGNKLFAEEKYDEANNKYRDALIESPESPIIQFNIGDALFKKHNYEEALKSYEKATSSDDLNLQAQGYYNLGNTLYKMGKLPESILAYKKALELNPNDEDAKYNLEYVRAKLKDSANKQPQQNQQQQQQQQQGQQNQDSQQQDREKQQKKNESDQQQGDDEQKQKSQQEQQQEQTQDQPETQPGELSKKDAERILNALKNDEQKLLQQQRVKKQGRAFRGKDW